MLNLNVLDLHSYNVGTLPLHWGELKLSYFPNKKSNPHWDEEIEFIYVKQGYMNVFINGEQIHLEEKELLLLSSKTVHYFATRDGSDCTFCSGLANESLFTSTPSILEKYIQPIFHSYHESYAIVHQHSPYYPEIADVLSRLDSLIFKKETGYEMLVVAKIHELLGLLYKPLESSFFLEYNADTLENRRFRTMLDYIYQNYSEKMLVEDIAEVGEVSRKTCYNLFHKYTGKTPLEFIQEYRLNQAKVLLQSTEQSISDIASNIGFSHQSHLTLQFTRAFGITPSGYRAKYSKAKKN